MIISRGRNCIRLLNSSNISRPSPSKLITRSSGRWGYRSYPKVTETQNRIADFLGAIFWGWVLYHAINDYELITGEYSAPDPSLWTDEELGIPPDSEGLPEIGEGTNS